MISIPQTVYPLQRILRKPYRASVSAWNFNDTIRFSSQPNTADSDIYASIQEDYDDLLAAIFRYRPYHGRGGLQEKKASYRFLLDLLKVPDVPEYEKIRNLISKGSPNKIDIAIDLTHLKPKKGTPKFAYVLQMKAPKNFDFSTLKKTHIRIPNREETFPSRMDEIRTILEKKGKRIESLFSAQYKNGVPRWEGLVGSATLNTGQCILRIDDGSRSDVNIGIYLKLPEISRWNDAENLKKTFWLEVHDYIQFMNLIRILEEGDVQFDFNQKNHILLDERNPIHKFYITGLLGNLEKTCPAVLSVTVCDLADTLSLGSYLARKQPQNQITETDVCARELLKRLLVAGYVTGLPLEDSKKSQLAGIFAAFGLTEADYIEIKNLYMEQRLHENIFENQLEAKLFPRDQSDGIQRQSIRQRLENEINAYLVTTPSPLMSDTGRARMKYETRKGAISKKPILFSTDLDDTFLLKTPEKGESPEAFKKRQEQVLQENIKAVNACQENMFVLLNTLLDVPKLQQRIEALDKQSNPDGAVTSVFNTLHLDCLSAANGQKLYFNKLNQPAATWIKKLTDQHTVLPWEEKHFLPEPNPFGRLPKNRPFPECIFTALYNSGYKRIKVLREYPNLGGAVYTKSENGRTFQVVFTSGQPDFGFSEVTGDQESFDNNAEQQRVIGELTQEIKNQFAELGLEAKVSLSSTTKIPGKYGTYHITLDVADKSIAVQEILLNYMANPKAVITAGDEIADLTMLKPLKRYYNKRGDPILSVPIVSGDNKTLWQAAKQNRRAKKVPLGEIYSELPTIYQRIMQKIALPQQDQKTVV